MDYYKGITYEVSNRELHTEIFWAKLLILLQRWLTRDAGPKLC